MVGAILNETVTTGVREALPCRNWVRRTVEELAKGSCEGRKADFNNGDGRFIDRVLHALTGTTQVLRSAM